MARKASSSKAQDNQISMLGNKKPVAQEKGQLVALGFLPMGSHFRTKGFHYVITQPGRQFVDATRSGHVKSGGNGYVIDRRNGADMVEWIATTEPGPGIMGVVGSIQADVTKVRSAVDSLQKLVTETFKGIKSPERKAKEPAREQVEKKARRSKKREREEEDRRRREYEDSIPF